MQEMRIYILNASNPYTDDEEAYHGDWFTCPVDYEEVKEMLQMKDGDTYSIADYELPFSISEDTPLWEINANCRTVQQLEGTALYDEMKEIQEKWFHGFDDFIDHKDDIQFYDVDDSEALARVLLLEKNLCGEIPSKLQAHIDYRSFGQELETSDEYLFTSSGVFRYR